MSSAACSPCSSSARRRTRSTVKQLAEVLNGDAFHAVRSEAAKALKKIATPEARAALARSLKQDDARCAASVVEALAAFPHPEAQEALWKQSQSEKNPLMLAAIIKTWGARPGDAKVVGSAADAAGVDEPSSSGRLGRHRRAAGAG